MWEVLAGRRRLITAAAMSNARVLVGNVNGDGKADLIITGASGWMKVVIGISKGDGTFTVVEYPNANFASWASRGNPLIGDFNGDGKSDILVVGAGWGTIPVAFSKGDGTFNVTNASVDTFTIAASARGARAFVGDLDGDGRDDVALTGVAGWTTVPVAFSNGDGTFAVTNNVVLSAWFNGGSHIVPRLGRTTERADFRWPPAGQSKDVPACHGSRGLEGRPAVHAGLPSAR